MKHPISLLKAFNGLLRLSRLKYCLIFALMIGQGEVVAAGPPLIVAVDNFSPPFISRGANNQIFGFDISMMNSICDRIQRTCRYKPMVFSKLLDAVSDNTAEAAIGSIIITSERAQSVNFSLPYLVSKSIFIGTSVQQGTRLFTLSQLNYQNIGAQKGSVYPQLLTTLGIIKPNIITYDTPADIIEALQNHDINYALLDEPAALYWQTQSNEIVPLGQAFTYGLGLGIAVNKANPNLLAEINRALLQYQNSKQFSEDYNHYLSYF